MTRLSRRWGGRHKETRMGKGIKRLKRKAEAHMTAHARGEEWARETSDRLRRLEAKDAEHALTVATLVEGLGRLERRVAKKGRGKDPGHSVKDGGVWVCSNCIVGIERVVQNVSGAGLCARCWAYSAILCKIDVPATVGHTTAPGCPCCPGAEHKGGQTFDVAYANMRRTKGERWTDGACVLHTGPYGWLYFDDGSQWCATDEGVRSTNWRKVDP